MTGVLAVVGVGTVLSGDFKSPVLTGVDTVISEDGVIAAVGRREDLAAAVAAADVVVDADGATLAPAVSTGTATSSLGTTRPGRRSDWQVTPAPVPMLRRVPPVGRRSPDAGR